jgi:asparagine synthase (glutamine-hydrolysing)
MGAIGGIVDLLARAENQNELVTKFLENLDRKLAWLGPDGSYRFCGSSSAMLYRPFHTTSDSVVDRQPLVSEDLVITCSGRLDNLADLSRCLELGKHTGQINVIAQAFRRWGSECFAHFQGDFAVAILDRRNRKLIFARDPCGVRPLYYLHQDGKVFWASMPDAILTALGMPLEVDRDYVSAYLSFEYDLRLSPFRNTSVVRPGHVVVVDSQRKTISRFWDIRDHAGNRETKTADEYEEQFRSLFFDAVRNRLRTEGTVTAQLSGGLDSSSIVLAADSVLGSERAKLVTISHVFDRASGSDEREFIALVEAQRGISGIHLREDDAPMLSECPDPSFVSFPNPIFFAGKHIVQMLDAMRSVGARVLLSGHAGDYALMSETPVPFQLADLLQGRRLNLLLKRVLPWSRATRRPIPNLLWHAALSPCCRPDRDPCEVRPPRWMHPNLQRDTMPAARARSAWKRFSGLPPSKRVFCAGIEDGIGIVASGHCGFYTTLGRIEMRFPYLDRALLEFLAGTPTDLLCRPGETRSLQRRALREVLPPRILSRTSKGSPEHAITLAIRDRHGALEEFVKTSIAWAADFVDGKEILTEIQHARHGACTNLMGLLRFISLEFWLAAIEKRPAYPRFHPSPMQQQSPGLAPADLCVERR